MYQPGVDSIMVALRKYINPYSDKFLILIRLQPVNKLPLELDENH